MSPVSIMSDNVFVLNVAVDIQGLLARKFSEFGKLRIGGKVNRISVGEFGVGNYDIGTGNVARLSRVYGMPGENFVSLTSGFSDTNFGWTPPGVFKLHHELRTFTFFKVLNSKYDSDPRSLVEVELPSSRFLSIRKLLLRNSLRLRELLLGNLQGALREIVGSSGFACVANESKKCNELNPKFKLSGALQSIILKIVKYALLSCAVFVFLTSGLVCLHNAPRSGLYGLIGIILIVVGGLFFSLMYDMFTP